jgi:monovalent cation:H+ antiporter-2, CPA2 family
MALATRDQARWSVHTMLIFRDITIVFSAAVVAGLISWRLRQPLILGYVLAGLVLSPLTPGPQIHDVHTFEVMAEIGVILLMFSIGAEFSVPELLRVKWIALVGAPIGILLCIALGVGAGAVLGWPTVQGVAVGCIISVASTMVMMRLLMERGELATEAGRLMITLTLVEDLAVVILTILLPSIGPASRAGVFQIFWKLGQAVLLLIPVVFVAWKAIPRLLERVRKTGSDEIALLVMLTICMVIATLTEMAGLSLALGAFIGGLLFGSCRDAHKLIERLFPIRDVFIALFFVTVGMLIDPNGLFSNWKLLGVIACLVVAGKFAIWFPLVRLFGYRAQTALRVGIGLTQIGEFSFVLARVALDAGLISRGIYNAALAASLVTILANAALFKLVRPAHAGAAGTAHMPAASAAA